MIQQPDVWDAVIIGGGAAGYFAAITCAAQALEAGQRLRVAILEKAERPLRKVLVSGGGRCNVTHALYEPAELVKYYPRGGRALRSSFARFQPKDTVAWFEQRGVRLKTEADGRIFPVSDNSQTVVDCLIRAAEEAGVALKAKAQVAALTIDRGLFSLAEKSGETRTARTVLLATGGEAHRLATGLGHSLTPLAPSLFTFTVRDPRIEGLAGVSVPHAQVRIVGGDAPELTQHGPLLITHWGLSGPAVLKLSAWGARWLWERQYRAEIAVNWLGQTTQQAAWDILMQQKSSAPRQKPAAHCLFESVPLRLWKRLVVAAGIGDEQNWADLSKATLRRLAEKLTGGSFAVLGKGPFKEEFVTCGGVPLDEVNLKTMESRITPGFFLAGEVLDVDGLTGGFNFQNAWTGGWIAGGAIAERLLR